MSEKLAGAGDHTSEAIFGTHGDHFREIRRTINVYRAAIEGKFDVHFWLDKNGAIFDTRIALPGSEVEETLDYLNPDFMRDMGINKGGIMSPQMLEQRISELSEGNGDQAIAEAG